ncbi:unnamed protein product [Rotaria socialis]|uniref:Uncharacterized protein n=1 Tax=Rotaria socialis TaxID=392032 RepID=A0A818E534_9BILA|nr:unnamed protein product [Rotaria socialis]CAF3390612.1 unnamed protein product [Rotaria socialis]CAF3447965.1 unnamed protein product [Rotaria socialis]CAF3450819.1 unnamed protein product [Rotaria socialis]CAF3482760.1 unnamed protein product [Rotaria socialis]
MLRCSRKFAHRNFVIISIVLTCFIVSRVFPGQSSVTEEQAIIQHKHHIFNASDSLVIVNLIDQFLHKNDPNERDELWSLIVQDWLNSFQMYSESAEIICTTSSFASSLAFIHQHLYDYAEKLLSKNKDLQKHLIGFGVFFDYDVKEIRSKSHDILRNLFLSICTYYELIVLIIKVQLALIELNINYFIGKNTLLGSLRHHDIIPWSSIVEFSLPLYSKTKFIDNINKKYELVLQEVTNAYINQKQIGLVYKVSSGSKPWPQIEIYFYEENSTQIYDSYINGNESAVKIGYLKKEDVFPIQLRPFGPLLLHSIRNPQAMISIQTLNTCESFPWNHQLEKQTDKNDHIQMSCERLHRVYSFVETRASWRRDYCEEKITTKRLPYRTLSYFRYNCSENTLNQFQ